MAGLGWTEGRPYLPCPWRSFCRGSWLQDREALDHPGKSATGRRRREFNESVRCARWKTKTDAPRSPHRRFLRTTRRAPEPEAGAARGCSTIARPGKSELTTPRGKFSTAEPGRQPPQRQVGDLLEVDPQRLFSVVERPGAKPPAGESVEVATKAGKQPEASRDSPWAKCAVRVRWRRVRRQELGPPGAALRPALLTSPASRRSAK